MDRVERRTHTDLETEVKMQSGTLGNVLSGQTDTLRLRDRVKGADRNPRQFNCLAYLSASSILSLSRLGPREKERRTLADLKTEEKIQTDTSVN